MLLIAGNRSNPVTWMLNLAHLLKATQMETPSRIREGPILLSVILSHTPKMQVKYSPEKVQVSPRATVTPLKTLPTILTKEAFEVRCLRQIGTWMIPDYAFFVQDAAF